MASLRQGLAVVCGIVVGPSCAYEPGSFDYSIHRFPGAHATVGCFDVAVERQADLPLGPVLGYDVANRCDHPQLIDFRALNVVGRDPAGREVALAPYDPRRELRPIALDGRTCGKEALAYRATAPVAQLCVDVAPLAHLTGVGLIAPTWRCFDGVGSIAPASPAAPVVVPDALVVGRAP